MHQIEDIYQFLEKHIYDEPVKPDSDIFDDFGCVGDDFDELIGDYATTFKVDMSDYLWYFHGDEEGNNFLAIQLVDPPYKRVKRIPVTPTMLLDFANSGKWSIEYPEHTLPKRRYDILFNQLLIVALVLYVIYSLVF
ncbi:DUF1493 family protein [Desertivirga xinjiangensis]|uniref:DUF1493 family protein n=1 Tax=Desertivirga xinjiangensis TaxID=539206 RepID=UPI00210D4270|nr:DUF1493 family protein [Pedobacter xinjiangensis]